MLRLLQADLGGEDLCIGLPGETVVKHQHV